ncbi:MAG: hypothetical protein ACOY82_15220 [Pseudomonadota bacterium]
MSRAHRLAASLLAAAAVFSAAGSAFADESRPWSQIDLAPIRLSDPDLFRMQIQAIDGRWTLTPEPMYPLAPGSHRFVMATTKAGFRDRVTYAEFALELQPCMNYVLVAEHERGTHNRKWQPRVLEARPIERCLQRFDLPAPPADAPLPQPAP